MGLALHVPSDRHTLPTATAWMAQSVGTSKAPNFGGSLRAVDAEPLLGGLGGQVARRVGFDLLLGHPEPARHQLALNGLVFSHPQPLERVAHPCFREPLHQRIFEREVEYEAAPTR